MHNEWPVRARVFVGAALLGLLGGQAANCNGFGDEPPIGFERRTATMQGFASAIAWRGNYVYLAAGAELQVYLAPPGATPRLLHEIELRDWVREMAIDGATLLLADRGDGLLAYDLAANPARPRLAGRVSGLFQADRFGSVEAVFNGLDARAGRVAVARANPVAKSQGGLDAVVFAYDPAQGSFSLVKALGTEVRSVTVKEVPITVGLTSDGRGLYVGYGVLSGELVYVALDSSQPALLQRKVGAVMDIATKGRTAFVAITRLSWPWVAISMLSRVRVVAGALVEEPLLTNPGLGSGNAVSIDGDLLCFGTGSPKRYEAGQHNLWMYRGLDAPSPVRVAAGDTMDWIYQVACRDGGAGSSWAYVADEWGGMQLWEEIDGGLQLDLTHQRIATGMFSLGMWMDFSLKTRW